MGIEPDSPSVFTWQKVLVTDGLLKLFVAWRVHGKLFRSRESQLRNSGLLYMCVVCNAGKQSKGIQED